MIFHFLNNFKMLILNIFIHRLCMANDENDSWLFPGYNLTGYSINSMMKENLFSSLPCVVEEIVMLQGGNFISSDSMVDDVLIISDRNIVTGMDDYSLNLCLSTVLNKLNFI